MENEVQPTIPPVQPLPQTPVPVPPSTNWSKTLLFTALGLVIVAGSVFFGIQIGKSQISNQQPVTVQPTITPSQTLVNPTALPTTNPTTDWKTYTNQKLSFTVKYPSNLYFKEIDPNYGIALTFEPYPDPLVPGSYFDSIGIYSDNYASYGYNILQQAVDGKSMTGYDLHQACGVTVTKLKNIKFGTFEGVEYIFDGSNPPSDCGRDLIGYEHTILIRKNDSMFIKLVNGSMESGNTRQHDIVFDQILSTFRFTN